MPRQICQSARNSGTKIHPMIRVMSFFIRRGALFGGDLRKSSLLSPSFLFLLSIKLFSQAWDLLEDAEFPLWAQEPLGRAAQGCRTCIATERVGKPRFKVIYPCLEMQSTLCCLEPNRPFAWDAVTHNSSDLLIVIFLFVGRVFASAEIRSYMCSSPLRKVKSERSETSDWLTKRRVATNSASLDAHFACFYFPLSCSIPPLPLFFSLWSVKLACFACEQTHCIITKEKTEARREKREPSQRVEKCGNVLGKNNKLYVKRWQGVCGPFLSPSPLYTRFGASKLHAQFNARILSSRI